MAKTFKYINEKMASFLMAQPVFFVATAPLSPDGHINCSPKGNNGTFQVLGPHGLSTGISTGAGWKRSPTYARTDG